MALVPLYIYKDISLGRILAVLAVITAAWQGGLATGAIAGVSLGMAMDLAGAGTPMYTMAYGLSGMMAGLCRGKARLWAAMVYVLVNGGAVLWTWERELPLSILYEVFVASVAFLLLPQRPMRKLGVWLAPRWPALWTCGPKPWSSISWRPQQRPSVPCATPCAPPSVPRRTTMT